MGGGGGWGVGGGLGGGREEKPVLKNPRPLCWGETTLRHLGYFPL